MEKESSSVIIGTILGAKIKLFWNIVFLAISALGHTNFFNLVFIRN